MLAAEKISSIRERVITGMPSFRPAAGPASFRFSHYTKVANSTNRAKMRTIIGMHNVFS